MLSILIPLFIIVPLIELAILIEIGQWIGTFYTVLLVVGTGIIGAILAKLEGMRVWHKLQKDLQELKMPTNRIIDGVLILIGSAMLLTPGILTDILGFCLIIPGPRNIIREIIKKRFSKKIIRINNY